MYELSSEIPTQENAESIVTEKIITDEPNKSGDSN